MVRTYKRRVNCRSYKRYKDEDLEKALEQISLSNMSINKASKEFKIPYGTLLNKYKGLHVQKPGGQTVLSKEEEEAVIQTIVTRNSSDSPLCIEDLQTLTKSFLDQRGRQVARFKNNTPSRDWVYSLIKRNGLKQRLTANIHLGCTNLSSPKKAGETKKEVEPDDTKEIELGDVYLMPEFVEVDGQQMSIEERIPNCLHNNSIRVGDKSTDEFQVFGDFVASELRNLRSRENQNKLKRMIQRSILEISEIDDGQITC